MTDTHQRICAIRLPGTSRARFVDAGNAAVSAGDWVVIDIGSGEEAGQIVVAPDQWITPVEMDDVPLVIRRLEDASLDDLGETIELARALIDPAASVMRAEAPGTFLTGLRLTIDRSAAIIVYLGPKPENSVAVSLQDTLSRVVDRHVTLEQDQPADPETAILGGGIGRPVRNDAETFQALLKRRIDVFRDPESFAPHGMPRLGSAVSCDAGEGTLESVDIRHWSATVRLSDGHEVTVAVDRLRKP